MKQNILDKINENYRTVSVKNKQKVLADLQLYLARYASADTMIYCENCKTKQGMSAHKRHCNKT